MNGESQQTRRREKSENILSGLGHPIENHCFQGGMLYTDLFFCVPRTSLYPHLCNIIASRAFFFFFLRSAVIGSLCYLTPGC